MSDAIYVYDDRGQYQRPVFVAYGLEDVTTLVKALYDGTFPAYIVVSRTRLHPYDGDRYKNTGSAGHMTKPKTGF